MALTVPLKIEDATDQAYLIRSPKNRYKSMEETLERFKDIDPKGRYLLLSPDDVRQLEDYVKDQVPSGAALLALVRRLTSVQIGGTSLPLTEVQLQTLKERAAFFGKPMDEFVIEELAKAVNYACSGVYAVARV